MNTIGHNYLFARSNTYSTLSRNYLSIASKIITEEHCMDPYVCIPISSSLDISSDHQVFCFFFSSSLCHESGTPQICQPAYSVTVNIRFSNRTSSSEIPTSSLRNKNATVLFKGNPSYTALFDHTRWLSTWWGPFVLRVNYISARCVSNYDYVLFQNLLIRFSFIPHRGWKPDSE